MKAIYFMSLSLVSLTIFSQQQGNVFVQNNINIAVQISQTNDLTNVSNLNVDNNHNDHKPIVQQ